MFYDDVKITNNWEECNQSIEQQSSELLCYFPIHAAHCEQQKDGQNLIIFTMPFLIICDLSWFVCYHKHCQIYCGEGGGVGLYAAQGIEKVFV